MKKIGFTPEIKPDQIGIYLIEFGLIVVRKKDSFYWLKWFGVEI